MDGIEKFKTYKIGKAAELLDVKPYVLRFWENEFSLLEPVRTSTGQRLYTEEHLVLVREIKRLLYDEGLTIEGAKKRLEDAGRNDFLREVGEELLQIKKLLS